jgi:hypothetical protein
VTLCSLGLGTGSTGREYTLLEAGVAVDRDLDVAYSYYIESYPFGSWYLFVQIIMDFE